MGSITIPQDYSLTFPGGIGIDTNLEGNLTTNNTAKLTGDPAQPIATLLIGDRDRPVATDSKMEILNLPRFALQDIKDMMKVRVRIPNYSQVCFKIFGQEIFSICMNGEGQIITEPYVPNAAERCETECCEPDTRPFPDNNTHNPNDPGIISEIK